MDNAIALVGADVAVFDMVHAPAVDVDSSACAEAMHNQ